MFVIIVILSNLYKYLDKLNFKNSVQKRKTNCTRLKVTTGNIIMEVGCQMFQIVNQISSNQDIYTLKHAIK